MTRHVKQDELPKGHQFNQHVRIVGKQYCLKCGLIALNNEATYRAIRGRCKGDS